MTIIAKITKCHSLPIFTLFFSIFSLHSALSIMENEEDKRFSSTCLKQLITEAKKYDVLLETALQSNSLDMQSAYKLMELQNKIKTALERFDNQYESRFIPVPISLPSINPSLFLPIALGTGAIILIFSANKMVRHYFVPKEKKEKVAELKENVLILERQILAKTSSDKLSQKATVLWQKFRKKETLKSIKKKLEDLLKQNEDQDQLKEQLKKRIISPKKEKHSTNLQTELKRHIDTLEKTEEELAVLIGGYTIQVENWITQVQQMLVKQAKPIVTPLDFSGIQQTDSNQYTDEDLARITLTMNGGGRSSNPSTIREQSVHDIVTDRSYRPRSSSTLDKSGSQSERDNRPRAGSFVGGVRRAFSGRRLKRTRTQGSVTFPRSPQPAPPKKSLSARTLRTPTPPLAQDDPQSSQDSSSSTSATRQDSSSSISATPEESTTSS